MNVNTLPAARLPLRRFDKSQFLAVLVVLVAVFAAILLGGLAGLGATIPAVLGGGVIGAGLLLAWPRACLWIVVVTSIVLAGLFELYLPKLAQIKWAVVGVSIMLVMLAVLSLAGIGRVGQRSKGSPPLRWAMAFFLFALLSIVAQGRLSFDWVIGMKGYFQVWGILLALAWMSFGREDSERFLRLLPWLALIQLPFVLQQFFVLVPQRTGALDAARNIVAVDIVTGTFGGSAEGGGRSTLLALLQVIAITIFIARWRAGLLRLRVALAASALCFAPLLLSEVKIVFVLLPFALGLLYADRLARNPFLVVLASALSAGLIVALLTIYTALPGAKSQQAKSPEEFLRDSIEYNFGDRGYGNAILNRTTVYSFWFKQNVVAGDVVGVVFGHGPGSANSDSRFLQNNLASSQYRRYYIGLTAISSMLWDFGLAGTIAAIGFVASAYLSARKLSRRLMGDPLWVYAKGAEIGIAMMGLTFLQNNYFMFDMSFQAMLFVLVGFVIAQTRAGDRQTVPAER